jgi:aminopeptidase N
MNRKQKICFIVLLFLVTASMKAQDISYLGAGGKLNPLQAIMDIRHYTLALDVNISQQTIDGYAEISLNLSKASDTLLFDLVRFLTVKKIWVNKEEQSFLHTGDAIYIFRKNGFKEGRQVVRVYYGGHPPIAVNPPWTGGFTFTKDRFNNPWVAINCQGEGAKIFYPCKDHPSDEPNEGADLLITVPDGLSVAGPGLLLGITKEKEHRSTWHWKTNYTISTYCIVFNIGKYKIFERPYTTINGNTVPIQLFLLEQDTAQANFLLDIKVRDSRVLEKYFGEYPWVKEKIGIVEVPNSGMEHQTMISFKDSLQFASYPNHVQYSAVYFHEYAHEWFANKITNRDWAHFWIQEGIATYAEALFLKEEVGEQAYDSFMIWNRFRTRNEKPIVPDDEVSLKDVNSDVYFKGACLMHALRYILGDSVFFPALKKFSTDQVYPYDRNFTSDDVEKHFSKAAGKDLKPLFNMYLKTNKTMKIEIFRSAPDTYVIVPFYLPLSLPIDILTDTGIVHLNITQDQVVNISSKTQPVIDPKEWYFKTVYSH